MVILQHQHIKTGINPSTVAPKLHKRVAIAVSLTHSIVGSEGLMSILHQVKKNKGRTVPSVSSVKDTF